MRVPGLTTVVQRARRLDTRARAVAAGGAVAAAVLAGALVFTVSGGLASDEPEEVVAVVATPTPPPTPAATRTPRPAPTPTPTPLGPVPAKEIPPGESAGLSNPSSEMLPPPPPAGRQSVANEAGVMRIVAPSIGMDHYIQTVGVVDGMMESTDADGSYAVGWYAPGGGYEFGVPGTKGNSVFSAHESWNHMQGPFFNLHKARVGDEIFLVMADGERRRYQVASVTRYPADAMPMAEVLWPSDRPEHEDWITLYTCGGEIIYDATGYGDYLSRDVLIAKWVGPAEPEQPSPRQLTRQ